MKALRQEIIDPTIGAHPCSVVKFIGYYIVVRKECFGSHAADLHDATLKNVRLFFGEVAASADMRAVWTGSESLRKAG